MHITEVTISAGRTFNHPFEDYSNLRPQVTLKATLQDGDNADQAVKDLQAKAESLVEDHKQLMLGTIRRLYELTRSEREIANIERELSNAQQKLANLKVERGALLGDGTEVARIAEAL